MEESILKLERFVDWVNERVLTSDSIADKQMCMYTVMALNKYMKEYTQQLMQQAQAQVAK